MKSQVRQKAIYEFIQKRQTVSVRTLKEHFGVSDMTIRRDLECLEQFGMVQRSYGKVTLALSMASEQTFASRKQINVEAKRRISVIALERVKNLHSIYLDGSSTCIFLAETLPNDRPYTVFTNNLETVYVLQNKPLITIFLLGGVYQQDMKTFDSSTSLTRIKDIYVDAALVSCAGFNKHGTMNNSIRILNEHKSVIENAEKTILLADTSKVDRRGLVPAETWDDIDELITDAPLGNELAACIQNKHVDIFY